VLNFLVMPVAVAGATALWVERLENRSKRQVENTGQNNSE